MTDTATKQQQPNKQPPTQDAPIEKADFQALAKVKVAGELDMLTTAKAFAASGMFPDVRTQSQAIVKIVAGYELGIPPFAAMQGFHCIPRRKKVRDDKGAERWVEEVEISMSANLRAAIVRRDQNIDLKIVEQSPEACEVEVAVRFAGQWENRGSVRYTIEEARKVQVPAGQGNTKPLTDGNMWKNYPADMLFAAVMRRVSKRYTPHLFIGDGPSNDEDDLITASATEEAPIEAELVDETPEREITNEKAEGGESAAAGTAVTDTRDDAGKGESDAPRDGADSHDVGRDANAPDGAPEQPETATPEAAREEGPAGGSDTSPPASTDSVWIGLLEVPYAGDGPWRADQEGGGRLRTKEQVTAAEKMLGKLNLVAGALEAICKARFHVTLAQASKTALDELNKWLEARIGIVAAKNAAAHEEPPF